MLRGEAPLNPGPAAHERRRARYAPESCDGGSGGAFANARPPYRHDMSLNCDMRRLSEGGPLVSALNKRHELEPGTVGPNFCKFNELETKHHPGAPL